MTRKYFHSSWSIGLQVVLRLGSRLILNSCLSAGKKYLAAADLSGANKLKSISKERELLIHISNALIRPLTAELRSCLGLLPPAGFMSLPLDLADKILGYLAVSYIASWLST